MGDYRRRLVIDADFETTVGGVCRAIREEGLQVLARTDVREHFWRHLSREFRQYALIEAWSPDSAFDALQHDLDVSTVLPTRFAIYELADGETVVVATAPMAPLADEVAWREQAPALAAVADQEREHIARVLERLTLTSHESSRISATPAA
jgi:uncharacterized protein (DUF302 family)